MRKAMKFALTLAVMVSFAMPLTMLAQAQVTVGSVSGRSVDAIGRGVFAERIELVRGTQVVSTITTSGSGEWSFRGVEPGDYIVRMNVRGRIAGVRVAVGVGQAVTGTMIVVPTAVSPQLGSLASLLSALPTAVAATTAAAASATLDVETVELNPTILVQILEALPVAERQAFAAAVVAAVESQATGTAPFAQYTEQFTAIVNSPTATIPTFPPPVPVS